MKTRALAVVVASILGWYSLGPVAHVAYAQEPMSRFTVLGPADVSCGKWTAMQRVWARERGNGNYEWWLAGFVTGVGYARSESYRTDAEGAAAWISKYCAEHPLERLVVAASELVRELARRVHAQ